MYKALELASIFTVLVEEPELNDWLLFIVPDSVADCAVNEPARFTLNGASAKALAPRCIPSAVDKDILDVPEPAVKEVSPTVKPPIEPVVALISPAISKSVPSNFK